MIVILDYDMGNPGSILNMIKRFGQDAVITSDDVAIERASKLILPGVGSFDKGMENLERLRLVPLLHKKVVEQKTPILGICLGMQLFTRRSEEGHRSGLGWVDADTKRFRLNDPHLKIPHMGWNRVKLHKRSRVMDELPDQARFYFVHSYHVVCDKEDDVLLTTKYEYDFVSAFQRENIVATQFHPEKSHKFGLQLIKNFVEMT